MSTRSRTAGAVKPYAVKLSVYFELLALSNINRQRSQWPAGSVMYLNNWDQWGRYREEEAQSTIFTSFPFDKELKRRLRGEQISRQKSDNGFRVMTVAALLHNMLWHWPAEEAWKGQADRVSITDHAHHLKHPDVLQLGRYMEAVKTVRLTAGVGTHALHEVRSASLQLTYHLWQRVLKESKGEEIQTKALAGDLQS